MDVPVVNQNTTIEGDLVKDVEHDSIRESKMSRFWGRFRG